MTIVLLGNAAPQDAESGDAIDAPNAVTQVSVEERDFDAAVASIRNLWAYHSTEPPLWVESDDADLAITLSRSFSTEDHEVPVGRPDDWDDDEADVLGPATEE